MGGTIEDTCEALEAIPDSILGEIGDLYNEAVIAHDEIQRTLNDNAKSSAWNHSGVVRVS